VCSSDLGADISKARTLLERAEHGCLIANSLRGERTLHAEVEVRSATVETELA
jgi:organic hydroperoxide reductase OsmC/OhrA